MSLLSEITTVLKSLKIPVETGVFKGKAPKKYMVLIPLVDTFQMYADNVPGADIQEVRISFFTQGNYRADAACLVKKLLCGDFTITDRRYNGYETETGYHHISIDVAKYYEYKMEE